MDYSYIISLQRPVSKKHYPMSLYQRAAQFAPFAALAGYGDAVHETARLTDSKIELDEDRAAEPDAKTQFIIEHAGELPEIKIEYFVTDKRKAGCSYHTIRGNLHWFDSSNFIVLLFSV